MSEINTAALNDAGYATSPGFITVYYFDANSSEFVCAGQEYLSEGMGIPPYSCTDAPPDPAQGFVPLRSSDGDWILLQDFRGIQVYDTSSLSSHVITDIGDIPEGFTTEIPLTPFDKWDGESWVTDTEAQQAYEVSVATEKKNELIKNISSEISILQDAINLNIATEVEKNKLVSLQTYRVLLNRVDTSQSPDIQWPLMSAVTSEVQNG